VLAEERDYGICLLVALLCGLSGNGSAACAGSLSPQSPPQISGDSPFALLVLILCSALITENLNPQQ
jgi:hypothetical protein